MQRTTQSSLGVPPYVAAPPDEEIGMTAGEVSVSPLHRQDVDCHAPPLKHSIRPPM